MMAGVPGVDADEPPIHSMGFALRGNQAGDVELASPLAAPNCLLLHVGHAAGLDSVDRGGP